MNRFIIAALVALASASASADYRMIVRLKSNATFTDAQNAAASLGGTMVDHTPNAPFALFALPDDPLTLTVAQLELATGLVDVLWAGDDSVLWSAESVSRGGSLSVISRGGSLSVIGDRSDLVQENSGYLSQIDWNADLAATDGRTVHVAILDSGLSRLQTTLWSKVDAYMDVFNGNADDHPMGRDSNGNGVFDEGVGHGTMVAGIMDTVAPKVRFVVAKVADSDGRASAWGIVKGLAFAVAQGAEIANVSIGGEDVVPAYSSAAEWAKTQGLLVVAAIGNGGESHAWYPAGDVNALAVAGLGSDDLKADFSNWDPKTACSAPAVGLVSQFWDGSLARWSGTSFAAPFVAASLADCLRRTTHKTPDFLIQAILGSGRSVDSVNSLVYRTNIGRALDVVSLDAKIRGLTP